jgi:hypothetical protein
MVSISASKKAAMVRAARRICQRPEVVIKRVVFLHDDNYVFHFFQVAIGIGWVRGQQSQNQRQE